MSRIVSVAVVALASALLVTGCTPAAEETPAVEPKIGPPAIAEEGVLRIGVDLEYPPFAGTDLGREAGIDIDVAEALAAELGLTVETVQVEPTRTAEALAAGEIDVGMSVPFDEESMTSMSLAGSYYTNGPAFFVSQEGTESDVPTLTIDSVAGMAFGAQQDAYAFWLLEYEYGEGQTMAYETLREALEALEAGDVEVVASDAFVTAYIARDFPTVRFAGQLEPATQYGIGVASDATELEEAVRTTLDALAANGVLDTIRTTWVGDLPELETEAAEES